MVIGTSDGNIYEDEFDYHMGRSMGKLEFASAGPTDQYTVGNPGSRSKEQLNPMGDAPIRPIPVDSIIEPSDKLEGTESTDELVGRIDQDQLKKNLEENKKLQSVDLKDYDLRDLSGIVEGTAAAFPFGLDIENMRKSENIEDKRNAPATKALTMPQDYYRALDAIHDRQSKANMPSHRADDTLATEAGLFDIVDPGDEQLARILKSMKEIKPMGPDKSKQSKKK